MARRLCCWVPVTSVLLSWNTVNNKHINTHKHTIHNTTTTQNHMWPLTLFWLKHFDEGICSTERSSCCSAACWVPSADNRPGLCCSSSVSVSGSQDVCHREGINNVAEASGFYNKCLICNFVTTQINAGSKHYSYQPVTRSATQTTRSNRSKQNHWRKTAAAHWVLVFLLILLSLALLAMPHSWHGLDGCGFGSAAVSAALNIDQANIAIILGNRDWNGTSLM